jgi:hypothetical protein
VKRQLALVFAAAVVLYVPTVGYGFVQDDRAVIVANPAAHDVGAALRAFDEPYWSDAYYRPATILSFAVDWALSGGRAGWMHLVNALWHGLVSMFVVLVLARWLPLAGAAAAGLVFVVHPVHVEGVANLVSRSELLAAAGILAAVLAARRRWWIGAVACALLAMLSKEIGVVTGVVLLIDDWLRPSGEDAYPPMFYAMLAAVTVGFLFVWLRIGYAASPDVAAPFIGASPGRRLAMAFPAVLRGTELLVWPAALSVDYNPRVIPYRTGFSAAAGLGAVVVLGIAALSLGARHRAPALSFSALLAALAYLPTSNLLFASGIVLAERNLYLPVLLPAAIFGTGVAWALQRWERSRVPLAAAVLLAALAARTLVRLPAWADNRSFLLTLLSEHPESYRGQQSAAAVLAGMGKPMEARAVYARADSLFGGDPHLKAGYAFLLIGQGDTAGAVPLARAARQIMPRERVALRVDYLLARARGERAHAAALVDTALGWFPLEREWYAAAGRP